MPSENIKILEFNQYQKSDKTPCIFYADIKSLIKKIDWWKSTPEISSTTKEGKHIPFVYSVLPTWAFDGIENKHYVYRGEDCMKKS